MNSKTATNLGILAVSVIATLAGSPWIVDFFINLEDDFAALVREMPWLPVLILYVVLAAMAAAQYALIMLGMRILRENEWFNNAEVRFHKMEFKVFNKTITFHKSKFKEAAYPDKTIKYVRKEYGLTIGRIDVKILELIHARKTTMTQLEKHSGLSMKQVKYRIKKMRRCELVSKEKLELHETLDRFFEHPGQMDYWLAEQPDDHAVLVGPNTCNKPGCDRPALTRARACQYHVCDHCQVGWKSGRGACSACQAKVVPVIAGGLIALFVMLILGRWRLGDD